MLERYKRKMVDLTSSFLADNFMGARSNRKRASEAQALAEDMRMVKDARGAGDGGDYRDPLFRARASVSNYKTRMDMEKKKKAIKRY